MDTQKSRHFFAKCALLYIPLSLCQLQSAAAYMRQKRLQNGCIVVVIVLTTYVFLLILLNSFRTAILVGGPHGFPIGYRGARMIRRGKEPFTLARKTLVLSTNGNHSPNRKGEALQIRVIHPAKLRIIAEADRIGEKEGAHVSLGRVVSQLAMAHLPPAPQERISPPRAPGQQRLTPARPGGGTRAATG
jgi:hypothetical protein